MKHDFDGLTWPLERIDELFAALGEQQGRGGAGSREPRAAERHVRAALFDGTEPVSDDELAFILISRARRAGLELEPLSATAGELARVLRRAAPLLVRVPGKQLGFLAILKRRGRTLRVLTADHAIAELDAGCVPRVLLAPLEKGVAEELTSLLSEVRLPAASRARRAMLEQRLRNRAVGDLFALRLSRSVARWGWLREASIFRAAGTLLVLAVLERALWLTSWVVLARDALSGRSDRGWLGAWMLLIVTGLCLRLLGAWLHGELGIKVCVELKRKLLEGALELEPEAMRGEGIGRLLGRIIEADALEALFLNGTTRTLLASIELGFAVFASSFGTRLVTLLLVLWTLLLGAVALAHARQRRSWTYQRLATTHTLIEKMVAHRTRLAQEPEESRHAGEDEALTFYLDRSRAMDRAAIRLRWVARSWIIAGTSAFAPAFYAGASSDLIAISLGAVLLGYHAFHELVHGLSDLAEGSTAWREVKPLLSRALDRREPRIDLGGAEPIRPAVHFVRAEPSVIVEATGLGFSYPGHTEPALANATVRIVTGDRLLLEGHSGGGKSTFVSLLSGLREPTTGLLLVAGIDGRSLGTSALRRHIALAPQFHENHILTESLCFNLLMGRRWPPRPDDVADAEATCRALGLGALLERMPGGIWQRVGEAGWQLSHGERSRIYIARALLRGAQLVVLDESFAALDPESLRQSLEHAGEVAPALLVVAHP